MRDVAVERGKVLVAAYQAEQVGAHRDQISGATGRTVQPPDQFLPPRLGSKVEGATIAFARLGDPGFDGLVDPVSVGTEIPRQRKEEAAPFRGIEIVIAIENFAGHRGTGGLATAGQYRLAEFDQAGGVFLSVVWRAAVEQGTPALRNGC